MPRLAKFAAIHEASHAVAVVANRGLLRADIKYVSIVPDHRLVRTRRPLQYRPSEQRQVKAFIEVMLAGIAGNVSYSRMTRNAALLGTGLRDWQLASEAAKWIDEANLDEMLEDAIGFVKRERAAVHALAEALMIEGRLTGIEVNRIVKMKLAGAGSG